MASRLYLRNIQSGIGTALAFMFPGRGASVVTNTVNLTNGGNNIPWTITAGGTVAEWVSPRTPSGGFTLSGNITFNGWFSESNNNDNCGVCARVYRRTPGGTETEVNGSPFNFGAPTEFTTTLAAKNWTGTPGAGLSFSEDDRVVVRFEAIEIGAGAMTVGTAAFTTNGATGAASGDSYIELTETVDWKTETITKTVKTASGDYSLLSAWESANQSDLVTDDVIAQAECYAGAYTDAVNITGWTTGASNYVRIYTPTAERHNGTARDVSGSGFQMSHSTSIVIESGEDYVRLEGLDLKSTSATLPVFRTQNINATNNSLQIDNCIFQNTALGSGTYSVQPATDADTIGWMRNCIVYGTGRGINANGAIEVSHCTVQVSGGLGISYNGSSTIKDNWVGGATTRCFDLISGSPTGSHNASTDATADDHFPTGALINKTAANQFVSLTGGAEDFHLKSGTDLNAAGTPLAAVPLDIVGTTRDGSTPDIGAFEFISITGTVSATLNAITAALTATETFTGTTAANLNAITAALEGEATGAAEPTGDIASDLSAITAALSGTETFTGTVASDLSAITSALAGTESFIGTVAGALNPITSALAGIVAASVEGTVAASLSAFTALLAGDGGAAIDVAGPVYGRGAYDTLKRRRRKKREDLEALAQELRILLGLETAPESPSPIETVDASLEVATAAPFLVGLEDQPLRAQVDRMLEAVRVLEERHRAALDDDDDAILILMEAA